MNPVCSSQPQTKLPNGPKTPVFIQTIQALLDQFGLLERAYQKYGDIFYTPKSFGFPPIVILSNLEAIEQVFSAPPELF
ncbi:MAG: hypothetical protein F6K24_58360 [Okeania sp. SIO2D1]|nr:hypothetical protein [Okeania sp. SIO2D1]